MDAIGYFHRIVGGVAEMQQGHETGPRWLVTFGEGIPWARRRWRLGVLEKRLWGGG